MSQENQENIPDSRPAQSVYFAPSKKNSVLKVIILVMSVVLLTVVAGWVLKESINSPGQTVAIVGQEKIKRSDWQNQIQLRREELPPEETAQLTDEQEEGLGREVLHDMINKELLTQYSQKNDLDIAEQVENELQEGKSDMGEVEFREMLEAEGLTESELKEMMHRQILVQMVIEAVYDELPQITDKDVREEYDQRATETNLPPFEEIEEEIRSELEEEWAQELRPMTYDYLRELIGVEVLID